MKLSTSTKHLRKFESQVCSSCDGEGYFAYINEEDEVVYEPCTRCNTNGIVGYFQDRYFNIINNAYKKNGWKIRTKTDVRNFN